MSNSKEMKTSKTESKIENTSPESSKKFKKPIRRASLVYQGATYLDEQYKKPGKVYRAVADTPGRIKYMESLGYEIVRDENFESGDSATLSGHNLGSAQTLEMGKTHKLQGVWMCIDEDEYKERQEAKAEENRKFFEDTVVENQFPGQKLRD